MKIEDKAITSISISVDFGVTNYRVCNTEKKRGMFFAAERNAINVEIQAFRNLTYNATLQARRGSSIESKNKFYPPVLPLAQQIVFDHPPSNICHSPAAGFFRPILSSLVNSSSLVPKTRPNRSTRKSVIRTRSVLSVIYSKYIVSSLSASSTAEMRRRPVFDTGFRP